MSTIFNISELALTTADAMDLDDEARDTLAMGLVARSSDGEILITAPIDYSVDADTAWGAGGPACSPRLLADLLQRWADRQFGADAFRVTVHNTGNGGGFAGSDAAEHLDHIINEALESLSEIVGWVLPAEDDVRVASYAAFEDDDDDEDDEDDDDDDMIVYRRHGTWMTGNWEDPEACSHPYFKVSDNGIDPNDQLCDLDELRRLCLADEWQRLTDLVGTPE